MVRDERNERSMGCLVDYNDPDCPFCSLISKSISLAWGDGWNSARLCSTATPLPQLFILSRSPLSVKQNGRTDHPQPRLLVAIDQKPPSFQRNRAALREIDRVENRFIIAEIETLPDDSSPSTLKEEYFVPRRRVGNHIDIQLVKRWLEECKKHQHSKKAMGRKDSNLFQLEHPFRLIDVIDECLVQKAERCDYVALSYVWGRIPTILAPGEDAEKIPILLTLQQNVEALSVPKSLSQSRQASRESGRIPRTVCDAMELTRQIGMRYLWVDTVCIVQDSQEDKARLIGCMDDVYDNATVTFVAASGIDADAGLSGISPRTGHLIEPAKIISASDGKALNLSLSLPSLCDEVRRATWNTRGWTFQEQCLSQRCLYFTAEEAFFNCTEVQWREGYDYGEEKRKNVDVQVRTGPPWWSMKLRRDLDPTPYHYLGGASRGLDIQSYQTAVQDYSRKNLTFSGDILNAFEGIFNRFKRSGEASELSIRQTQGIPTHFLYQALLWFPSDDSKKRMSNYGQPGGLAEEFSTWSWASWSGPIEFVFADSLWLSRNISQAPIKRVPIYVPITCWYYGDSSRKFWSRDTWKAASEAQNDTTGHVSDDLSRTKRYLGDRIGINVGLLDQSLEKVPPNLSCGELGFFGPYLPSSEFRISAATGEHVGSLEVSVHRGEFRFDDEVEKVDELVAVVAADTITKPPDTQSILLGLVTQDGISRRVGIGFIYYSKDPSAPKPGWQYRFFKVR
ncbi:heterokaryon incompatibility protein-domain-containing protein [Xylogone sp. PMI_703]|nr:heterokaryon incompatibility protein-domain-containing protein [Xylogone sp. PMI_703]